MKREGRQHGVVRSYAILPSQLSQRRFVKTVDSAAAAGLFTKVSRKPTNQSKFTGKCGKPRCPGCHIHPACKSKDKAKGTMKLKSIDVNYPAGTSASGVLAYLANDHVGGYDHEEDDYYDDYDEGNVDDQNYNYSYDNDYDYDYDYESTRNVEFEVGIGIGIAAIITEELRNDDGDGEVDMDDDDDDDDRMSFCDVGLCWGHGDEDNDDDGWYLVGEMQ